MEELLLNTKINKEYYNEIIPEQILELVKDKDVKGVYTRPVMYKGHTRLWNFGNPKRLVETEIIGISFEIDLGNNEDYNVWINSDYTRVKWYKWKTEEKRGDWESKSVVKEKDIFKTEDLTMTDEYLESYWNTLKNIQEKQNGKYIISEFPGQYTREWQPDNGSLAEDFARLGNVLRGE